MSDSRMPHFFIMRSVASIGRLLKSSLAEVINAQVREALRALPEQIAQVEEVRILDIQSG